MEYLHFIASVIASSNMPHQRVYGWIKHSVSAIWDYMYMIHTHTHTHTQIAIKNNARIPSLPCVYLLFRVAFITVIMKVRRPCSLYAFYFTSPSHQCNIYPLKLTSSCLFWGIEILFYVISWDFLSRCLCANCALTFSIMC